MERYYTDKGFISKGASLNVKNDGDTLFHLLVPTTDMPQTKSAPSTQQKTVLTDDSHTEVEGLQSNAQKTYTFNYHRDNIRTLKKYQGKELEFLERNPDDTGEMFRGTLKFGRSQMSVDGIVQGVIYITVSQAEPDPVDDVRDLLQQTAIVTTPLNDVTVAMGSTFVQKLETNPDDATITCTSESTAVATVAFATGTMTITPVAVGNTIIKVAVSKTGEATSERTVAVEVVSAG